MAAKEVSPLADDEFAKAMAAFAPFETTPTLAVAVSGGRDSLALALLAQNWVGPLGGKLVVLTVDHALRAASAQEAAQVKSWMMERGIEHYTLVWEGEKPSSALQEQARKARYRLLEGWCRTHKVLHLLLGHHLDDQNETYILRKNKGSGPDGLASMASVTETRYPRLLRPLLGVGREQITVTLEAFSQEWINDPSNEDVRFERVRIRKTDERNIGDIGALQLSRRNREKELSHKLAKSTFLHPLGFAQVDMSRLDGDDENVLSQVILSVGGGTYRPKKEALARLYKEIISAQDKFTATLGNCVVSIKEQHLNIWRENRNLPDELALKDGETIYWDKRFKIIALKPITIRPLGELGIAVLKENDLLPAVQREVWATLPACWDEKGLLAVPLLGYIRGETGEEPQKVAEMTFSPAHPLLGIGLRLA